MNNRASFHLLILSQSVGELYDSSPIVRLKLLLICSRQKKDIKSILINRSSQKSRKKANVLQIVVHISSDKKRSFEEICLMTRY